MVQYEKDWLMRQVQMLVQFIARVVFKLDVISYEINEEQDSEINELYICLSELLSANEICDAEDMLYDNFEGSKDYLRLAMWFYNEINLLTDEELEASNFSRDEVFEGLQSVLSKSGIPL